MKPTTVIVGASVAGVRTAQALRSNGYHGRIVLVGEEPDLPYDKPPPSKGVLAGTSALDDIRLLTERGAADLAIELELGRPADRLDLTGSRLYLADGTGIPFDDLVIATGARPRPSGWEQLDGVHVLRTAADAMAIRSAFARGGPVAVVGGGFIGTEVAATARAAGIADVTVIDTAPSLLARAVPAVVGERIGQLHRRHGVRLRLGTPVVAVDALGGGDVRIRMADESEVVATTVVVGVGAVPRDAWLNGSGLKVDDGVVCDQFGRAAPHVFAVGDVSRWRHPRHGRATRVQHWTNAVEQAGCVGHTIAQPGRPLAHDPVEYVWTDQYDWRLQIVGRTGADHECRTVERAGTTGGLAILFGADDRLTGAVVLNWPRALVVCRRAVSATSRLADLHGGLVRLAAA